MLSWQCSSPTVSLRLLRRFDPQMEEYLANCGLPILDYVEIDHPAGTYITAYNNFYDSIIGDDEI